MPGRDGTGPLGQGSMTGWGLGNCADSNSSENSVNYNRVPARGYGYGCGAGRFGRGRFYGRGIRAGFRGRGTFCFWEPIGTVDNTENEIKSLREEQKNIVSTLSRIEERLNELESPKGENE